MSRLDIPKILKQLELAQYAPEFGDAVIQVWVNPPRDMLRQYGELLGEMKRLQAVIGIGDELNPDLVGQHAEALRSVHDHLKAWFASVWSQGPDETHWSEEDIGALLEHSNETDPGLWSWLVEQTMRLIGEHRKRQKKT